MVEQKSRISVVGRYLSFGAVVFLSFSTFFSVCAQSSNTEKPNIEKLNRAKPGLGFPKKDISTARYIGTVSMLKIISRPEDYHRRFIVTSGFLTAERTNHLYLNEIEGRKHLTNNSILLNIRTDAVDNTEHGKPDVAGMNLKYVFVEGVFDQFDRDPNYYPNGSIQVSRIFTGMGD
jgi:hypothetical protein